MSGMDSIILTLEDAVIMCSLAYFEYSDPAVLYPDTFTRIVPNIKRYTSMCTANEAVTSMTTDQKTFIVAFRGSYNLQNFFTDVEINMVTPTFAPDSEVKFHSGFYQEYLTLCTPIVQEINKFMINGGETVVLIGHSSGGCIASIFAYYLSLTSIADHPRVVTFGSPSFTNTKGVDWFDLKTNYYRIVNVGDPIPPLLGFKSKHAKYLQIKKKVFVLTNDSFEINPEIQPVTFCEYIRTIFVRIGFIPKHFIGTYIGKVIDLVNDIPII